MREADRAPDAQVRGETDFQAVAQDLRERTKALDATLRAHHALWLTRDLFDVLNDEERTDRRMNGIPVFVQQSTNNQSRPWKLYDMRHLSKARG